MYINELFKNVEVINVIGDNTEVSHLTFSTDNIQKGSLFFCIEGLKADGHVYAQMAVNLGATVIVANRNLNINGKCTKVIVRDTRKAMAIIAANFYMNPAKRMDLIGVTGTNGKTTTTFMIKAIFDCYQKKSGLLGTVYNFTGKLKEEASRTTMESLELQKEFLEMNEAGIDVCIMEVSSHSLAMKRVFGLYFKIGIFTNLTQDHLDFHKDMQEYFEVKTELLKASDISIINIDDDYGKKVVNAISGKKLLFGIDNQNECDFFARNIVSDDSGTSFELCHKKEAIMVTLNLPGKFNVYNALGAASAAYAYGISLDKISQGLTQLENVPGRSEKINSKNGVTIIIDYAHTPDGLYNILKTAREYTKGRLFVVFGCGGDRDKSKRSVMGQIAGELADFAIITSDNPRSEEPSAIILDIIAGLSDSSCEYKIIVDRREAIFYAIKAAVNQDVIVIAGKGHETYQVLKDKTIQFDERKIVREFLEGDY